MARAPRALVEGASILAALDEAAHGAVANLDGHVIDGGVLRQREGVEGFDVLGRGVGEDLGHRDASEEPADAGAHVGVFERARALHPAVFADDAERAGSFTGRGRGENFLLRTDGDEQQDSENNGGEDRLHGAPDVTLHGNLRERLSRNRGATLDVATGHWKFHPGGRLQKEPVEFSRTVTAWAATKRRPARRTMRHPSTPANSMVRVQARMTGT